MALVSNGVQNDVKEGQLPDGQTATSVTEFTDYESTRNDTLTVTKADVDEADANTTFTAIIAAIKTQMDAIVTAEYDVTNTVTTYSSFTYISLNSDGKDDVRFTTGAPAYSCRVTTYIKSA